MNVQSRAKTFTAGAPKKIRSSVRTASGVGAAVAIVFLSACGGKSATSTASSPGTGQTPASVLNVSSLPNETPRGRSPITTLNWNLFYEPTALDPAHALDYSENEVVSNLCDTLIRMKPDFSYEPGLATSTNPNPTTWIYTIHSGAKFWDGAPVTAADVAYSLNRNLDPKVASYWADYFQNVTSITATSASEVTVKLNRPDEVFNQGMSLAAGAVSEQKFDQAHGKNVGTAGVGIMCSGPYKFLSWSPGNNIVIMRNDNYWDSRIKAKVGKVVFSMIGTDAAQTNSLTSGSVSGMYETPISGTNALSSADGKLYLGKSLTQYMMQCITHPGQPADPINNTYIRQALSLAIDRNSVAKTIFNGVAASPTSNAVFAAADTYSYAKDVFVQATKDLPPLTQDIVKAKSLVAKAGNPTAPIVVSYANDGPAYNVQFAQYLQSAAQAIGLTLKLNPMPTAQFNNLGFDKKLDDFTDIALSVWFNELPDPVQWYRLFTPSASGSLSVFNYGQYQNAAVTSSIQAASAATDDVQRAKYVVAAQKQIMTDLPWIPVVDLPNRLYMGKGITGAPASAVQSWYPWAAAIGSTN